MTENRFTVGITGGIGSGKTAASDWFAQQGIDVVDADIEARHVVAKGSPTLLTIVQEFGDWVLTSDGLLNRKALRGHIFSTPSARKKLEAITHPAIRENIIKKLIKSDSDYTVLVVPLLFEGGKTGLGSLCDRTLVVDVPVALQKQRAATRDTQTLEQIDAIINSQISREKRQHYADDIIDNSQDVPFLYQQLIPLHQRYLQLAANHL